MIATIVSHLPFFHRQSGKAPQEHTMGSADAQAAAAHLAATLAKRSDGGARAVAPVGRKPLDAAAALEVEERALAAQQAQLDAETASAIAQNWGQPASAMVSADNALPGSLAAEVGCVLQSALDTQHSDCTCATAVLHAAVRATWQPCIASVALH